MTLLDAYLTSLILLLLLWRTDDMTEETRETISIFAALPLGACFLVAWRLIGKIT